MWARRCGAPPLWPSRIKVFLQSFLTAALGVAIFNYMTAADVGYLNLAMPEYTEVLCLTNWPLRHETEAWWSQDWWVSWSQYTTDMLAFVNSHQCNPSPNVTERCEDITVPLHDMQRKLGIPLGRTSEYQFTNDVLEAYALVFLYLTICLWVAVMFHDLTLLSKNNQRAVLDLRGVDREFPCFRKLFWLMGFRPWRNKVVASKGALHIILLIMAPLVICWSISFFLGVICPCCMLLFLRYPIRLGRLQIFVLCLLMTVLCLTLSIRCFVSLGHSEWRPTYAITWEELPGCQCGCVFPISSSGIWKVAGMAVVIGYKSVMLSLRGLKGLRRANWANLMTVMFAIPLTVYPTEWTKPDGTPIQFRKEHDPVQGEPAFDPFAMMDEQLDSAKTTCNLIPTLIEQNATKDVKPHSSKREKMSAPRMPTTALKEADLYAEDVGCCGFPYLTKAPFEPEDASDTPEMGANGERSTERSTEGPASV